MVKAIRHHHNLCFDDFPKPVLNLRPAKMLLASPQTLECDQPCKTKQNGRENTSDEVMQSGFCGYFPSLQIQVFFRGVTGKLKGIAFPQSLWGEFLFFPFLSTLVNPIVRFLSESQKCSFPSVPQGTWEKVGISLCWQHCVSVFSLHTAAIESQSGTIPRMVSRISIQSTKKRIQSKWMTGLVSPLWYGVCTAESRG